MTQSGHGLLRIAAVQLVSDRQSQIPAVIIDAVGVVLTVSRRPFSPDMRREQRAEPRLAGRQVEHIGGDEPRRNLRASSPITLITPRSGRRATFIIYAYAGRARIARRLILPPRIRHFVNTSAWAIMRSK